MKKIVFITRPLVPPWNEASKNLTYTLVRNIKSFSITILTNRQVPDFPENVQQLAIYSAKDLSLFQKAKLIRLRKFIKEFNIIHYMFTPSRLNTLMSKLFLQNNNSRTIQTVSGLKILEYPIYKLEQILFGDVIITYSNYARKELTSKGVRKNIKTVYPGIDLEHYKLRTRNKEMDNLFSVKNGEFVVVYPGEYVTLGTSEILINVLPKLIAKIPSLKFVFACRVRSRNDSLEKERIMKIMKKNGINEKIVYTDTVEDMSELYNLSDIIIFPALSIHGEKFAVPLTIIESMACSKPVIVSALEGIKEFTSSSNCITIPVGDEEALTSAILKLYQEPDLRRSIGYRARKYAEKNFNIHSIAPKYEAIYKELLSNV